MTRKEVIEGNKLIAEFITIGVNTETGWLHFRHPEIEAAPSDYEYYRFEESWDWLMPCIGKISNQCEEPDELDNLKYCLLTNNIEEAWKFVVNYLTYYYEYNSTRKNSLLSNS